MRKKADLIAAAAPVIVAEAAKGSLTAVLADAEVFAGAVVEEEVVASLKRRRGGASWAGD